MALLYETLRHPCSDSALLLITGTRSIMITWKVCAGTGTGGCQPATERCCNPPFDVRVAYPGVSNARGRRRRAPREISVCFASSPSSAGAAGRFCRRTRNSDCRTISGSPCRFREPGFPRADVWAAALQLRLLAKLADIPRSEAALLR